MMQEWFRDARLGIFIHWGIYSVGDTDESWDMFNGVLSREAYNAQAGEFTAAEYDAAHWAELFAAAGARYAVLTSKHHDGFSLWDSALTPWNAREAAPSGRDVVGPYADALRARGLRVGMYFSHSDWHHPDYASVRPIEPTPMQVHEDMRSNPMAFAQGTQDPVAWERYLGFHRGQLRELCERYRPDLLWFDADWERDPAQWRFDELREDLNHWSPGVVINGRMGEYGDYSTPEQALPVLPPDGPWEYCVSINDSWGYRKGDHNFKSAHQCIELLIECTGMGGNLLLDVGPTATGRIIPEQEAVLRGIGRWLHKHSEAVHGTRAGLPPGHFWGPTTLNKAGDTLYVFCMGKPDPQIALRGLLTPVARASVVGGDGSDLPTQVLGGAWWTDLPGILWIDVPASQLDSDFTVVKLEFDTPLRLYRGSGDKIMHKLLSAGGTRVRPESRT